MSDLECKHGRLARQCDSCDLERAYERIVVLEGALLMFADDIERAYGALSPHEHPGPPTSLVADMRKIAKEEIASDGLPTGETK